MGLCESYRYVNLAPVAAAQHAGALTDPSDDSSFYC